MLDILEPVNVWVLFKSSQIQPLVFFWKNRQIKVEKINLIHTSKIDGRLFYHFSISSGDNFYRLRFDTRDLKWSLEALEEG